MGTPPDDVDYGLELLRDYHGRLEHLPGGYYLKFEIVRTEATDERPHGLRYSFTLHNAHGTRVLGFDNAHGVKALGRRGKRQSAYDHWHRTARDKGRPYRYVDAPTLLQHFYDEAERTLREQGIPFDVIGEEMTDQEEGR